MRSFKNASKKEHSNCSVIREWVDTTERKETV